MQPSTSQSLAHPQRHMTEETAGSPQRSAAHESKSAGALGVHWPVDHYVVLGSVLNLGVTASGFEGIDKPARALVPAMVLVPGRCRRWR